ncbi:MAG: TetR family transcriptional regulator, partial [Actinomycetota bacterium]|nr:TetR family transcriptional regulator [Actinomycetota bacterium]
MPTTRPVKPSTPALAAQPGSATQPDSATRAASATQSVPGAPAAPAAQTAPGTPRSQAKEVRRQALLAAAAALFALHGFNRVSLEDLGAAAG